MSDVFIKIASAVAIAGVIHTRGSVVSISEDLAVNLLDRGMAEVATEDEALLALEPEAPAEPDAPAEPTAPPAKAGK
jgi:hypothetical protein